MKAPQIMGISVFGNDRNYYSIKHVVHNPHFIKDVIKSLGLNASESEVEEQIVAIHTKYALTEEQQCVGELTLGEKLCAFIDRVEFIEHLRLLLENVKKLKYRLPEREVKGLDHDIEALRLYLALTCIDILGEQKTNKEDFRSALEDAPDEIRNKWRDNIGIPSSDGAIYHELEEIADYLYDIRNNYTHNGKRFYILRNAPIAQSQDFSVGTRKSREVRTITVAENFDLIECVLELANHCAKRRFKWN